MRKVKWAFLTLRTPMYSMTIVHITNRINIFVNYRITHSLHAEQKNRFLGVNIAIVIIEVVNYVDAFEFRTIFSIRMDVAYKEMCMCSKLVTVRFIDCTRDLEPCKSTHITVANLTNS